MLIPVTRYTVPPSRSPVLGFSSGEDPRSSESAQLQTQSHRVLHVADSVATLAGRYSQPDSQHYCQYARAHTLAGQLNKQYTSEQDKLWQEADAVRTKLQVYAVSCFKLHCILRMGALNPAM